MEVLKASECISDTLRCSQDQLTYDLQQTRSCLEDSQGNTAALLAELQARERLLQSTNETLLIKVPSQRGSPPSSHVPQKSVGAIRVMEVKSPRGMCLVVGVGSHPSEGQDLQPGESLRAPQHGSPLRPGLRRPRQCWEHPVAPAG